MPAKQNETHLLLFNSPPILFFLLSATFNYYVHLYLVTHCPFLLLLPLPVSFSLSLLLSSSYTLLIAYSLQFSFQVFQPTNDWIECLIELNCASFQSLSSILTHSFTHNCSLPPISHAIGMFFFSLLLHLLLDQESFFPFFFSLLSSSSSFFNPPRLVSFVARNSLPPPSFSRATRSEHRIQFLF